MRAEGAKQLKISPLAVLAHELRSPLAASRSAMMLLLDGDLGKVSDEQQAYLENVLQLNEYMISLVSSWSEMERLNQGVVNLEVEPCNLGVLTQEVVRDLQSLTRKRKRTIMLPDRAQWPMVLADPLRLQQIMINLLDNALRHGKPSYDIEVRLRLQGNYVVLTFHDATPVTHQQRLATRNVLRGTTAAHHLGLRISRLLAEAHGGSLRLDPHAKQGMVFHLRLPLAQQMSIFDPDSEPTVY